MVKSLTLNVIKDQEVKGVRESATRMPTGGTRTQNPGSAVNMEFKWEETDASRGS